MIRQTLIFILVFNLASLSLVSRDIKKIEFDISLGIASSNPENLYIRYNGIDSLIQQYTRHNTITSTPSGDYKKIKSFIPIDLTLNYMLSEKLYLSGGIEYSFGKSSSNKNYLLTWDNFSEDHTYQHKNNITMFFPHVGIGYRNKALSLYGSLGFGFAKVDHQQDFTYSDTINRYDENQRFKVNGSQPGFKIGIKYKIKQFKKQSIFVKLEYLYLSITKLTGTKDFRATPSIPGGNSESTKGTLYRYDWNPFGMGFIEYWDLHESSPQDALIQNATELILNLSSLRLMIGISF
jgi:hypothetical protein